MSRPVPTYEFTRVLACPSYGCPRTPCYITKTDECARSLVAPRVRNIPIPLLRQLADYLEDHSTDLSIIYDGYVPGYGEMFTIGMTGGCDVIFAKDTCLRRRSRE